MIDAENLTMRIGTRELIVDAGFRVGKGMRVGLVGRNGAGKTTLMWLMTGEGATSDVVEATGTLNRRGTIGYLPQDTQEGDLDQTARDRIFSVHGIAKTIRHIRKAEREIAESEGTRQVRATERYVRLDQEFTNVGGWAANAEAAQTAAVLGLPERVLDQPLHTFSGGQRRRVELARILFSRTENLLLDEPTNHLDHDSILWLRDYLRSFVGGFVVVFHSTELLDQTVNAVWYLDANRAALDVYNMPWAEYLKQREADEERHRRERVSAERKAGVLMGQADKMRAKAMKAAAAQNMGRHAQRLLTGLKEEKKTDKAASLRLPDPASCGHTPLTTVGSSKSYGSPEVFSGLDPAVGHGSHVVVLGLNGAEKTTLLRLLAGVEEADTGGVVPGHGLKIGYYAQEHEAIDPDEAAVGNPWRAAPELDDTRARSVLGSLLSSGADADEPAGVPPGGEKARLVLAMLVVLAANVLLLDEPTSDLDPASCGEILAALGKYEGAAVLVTHDEGAVETLRPEHVLLLPDDDEDLWSDGYFDLIALA